MSSGLIQKMAVMKLLAATIFVMSASAGYCQGGPFAGLNGSWSGSGTVSLADGSKERIRCRANYTVDATGSGLRQSLRCASDSYKFDLASNVTS